MTAEPGSWWTEAMIAADLMTAPAVTIGPDELVSSAARLMAARRSGGGSPGGHGDGRRPVGRLPSCTADS